MPRHSTEQERNRGKRHVKKLMDAGLCVHCRLPNDRKTRRCKACTDKAVQLNKRIKQKAMASGKCATCHEPWIGKTKNCQTCKEASRKIWQAKSGSGICTRCRSPNDSKYKACHNCRDEMRQASNRRREEFFATGRCCQCGKEKTGPSLLCDKHIIQAAARRYIGGIQNWKQLEEMLRKQQYRCAYTGEKLILGENASVDHKIPKSRGGDDDINNVHWVTWTSNRSKTDMTHEEFIAMCHAVAKLNPLI